MPTQDRTAQGRKLSNYRLDEQLREANGFLKQIGDWLVQFAKMYKQSLKNVDAAKLETESALKQVKMTESRLQISEQA